MCLERPWAVQGKMKFESQHRTGCSAPAWLFHGADVYQVCFVRLYGARCIAVLTVLSCEKQYLLSWFKQVIIIHEQIRSWQLGTAKLPFSYSLGLSPKDTALLVQKWSLGDCFKCWRLPPLTYFLLYQRHSWLDRKACWLAPSHPDCFCTSLLCSAGACSYSFFMTFPHYTLFNCSLFLWPWSPPGQSKRSGTVFLSYLLESREIWWNFLAKKFVWMYLLFWLSLVEYFFVLQLCIKISI